MNSDPRSDDETDVEWREPVPDRLRRLMTRTHYPNCGHHWAHACDCGAEHDIGEVLSQITALSARVQTLTEQRDEAKDALERREGHFVALNESACRQINNANTRADAAVAARDAITQAVEKLVSALERTERNFRLAIAGKPVRDMCETLAENESVLAAVRAAVPEEERNG